MLRDSISGSSQVRGHIRLHRVKSNYGITLAGLKDKKPVWLPGRWKSTGGGRHNDILYDWAAIVSQQLANGGTAYRIGGIYLEYQNVAEPGDPVTVPAFDRTGGISYYDGLAGNPTVDYLRVPLIAAVLSNSNPSLYDGDNVITFFAQSQGVVGVNGKPFSDVNNSTVYGGALVAIPDLADRTQDLVFSRGYVPTDQQQIKLASSQIGAQWIVTLQ